MARQQDDSDSGSDDSNVPTGGNSNVARGGKCKSISTTLLSINNACRSVNEDSSDSEEILPFNWSRHEKATISIRQAETRTKRKEPRPSSPERRQSKDHIEPKRDAEACPGWWPGMVPIESPSFRQAESLRTRKSRFDAKETSMLPVDLQSKGATNSAQASGAEAGSRKVRGFRWSLVEQESGCQKKKPQQERQKPRKEPHLRESFDGPTQNNKPNLLKEGQHEYIRSDMAVISFL